MREDRLAGRAFSYCSIRRGTRNHKRVHHPGLVQHGVGLRHAGVCAPDAFGCYSCAVHTQALRVRAAGAVQHCVGFLQARRRHPPDHGRSGGGGAEAAGPLRCTGAGEPLRLSPGVRAGAGQAPRAAPGRLRGRHARHAHGLQRQGLRGPPLPYWRGQLRRSGLAGAPEAAGHLRSRPRVLPAGTAPHRAAAAGGGRAQGHLRPGAQARPLLRGVGPLAVQRRGRPRHPLPRERHPRGAHRPSSLAPLLQHADQRHDRQRPLRRVPARHRHRPRLGRGPGWPPQGRRAPLLLKHAVHIMRGGHPPAPTPLSRPEPDLCQWRALRSE
mmetsp:Transcript_69821/g.204367  ORF Transcript_69821/g.204367 Transcript_69821/m.204367 type:complete len:326 (-) Transcript_69821:60-1037(-)